MEIDSFTLLKAVFNSTGDGLLVVSDQGQVIEYNDRFSEMWRIPESILASNNDQKLLDYITDQLAEPEEFFNKVKSLYSDFEAISNDEINFKDGRYFQRLSRPLKMGEVNGGRIWSFRDITESKKNQEVIAAITDLSPDIISIINTDGLLVFNSPAAVRIHGYSQNELLGCNTFDLIHDEEKEVVQNAMTELLDHPDKVVSVQYRYKNKDESFIWMEATASNQINNPRIKGLVTISREISGRKQMEKDLSNALKQRDDFISIASHELKTPITSIKLQLQMMERARKKEQATESRDKSENISGLIVQINYLQRLIEDLLSASRINSGRLNFDMSNQNLSTIVQMMVERFRGLFEDAKCELKINIEEGIIIFCDRLRIEQVIINLISNAIKYAPKTLIEIQLKRSSGKAELIVKDQGRGIPMEKQESIFRPFERGSSCNYASGLGVGLFISRNIILQHNGTIHVESTVNKGSSFITRLPVI